MIGARDMAFPRLNAFSFWMTALGGLFLYFSFFGGDGLVAGRRARRRMVRVCTTNCQNILSRPQYGSSGHSPARVRHRQRRNRNQHRRHGCLHALSGNDA